MGQVVPVEAVLAGQPVGELPRRRDGRQQEGVVAAGLQERVAHRGRRAARGQDDQAAGEVGVQVKEPPRQGRQRAPRQGKVMVVQGHDDLGEDDVP